MHPAPMPTTEQFIVTNPGALDDALTHAIATDISAFDIADDEDSSAEYRRHLAETVTRRAIVVATNQKVSA